MKLKEVRYYIIGFVRLISMYFSLGVYAIKEKLGNIKCKLRRNKNNRREE